MLIILFLYFRYIGKVGFDSDFDDIEVSNIDISVFVLIFIQVSFNHLRITIIICDKKYQNHNKFCSATFFSQKKSPKLLNIMNVC